MKIFLRIIGIIAAFAAIAYSLHMLGVVAGVVHYIAGV